MNDPVTECMTRDKPINDNLKYIESLRRYKIYTFIPDPDNPPCVSRNPNTAYVHFINGVVNVENSRLISEKYFDKEEEAKQCYLQEIEKQDNIKHRDSLWTYIALVDCEHRTSRPPFSEDEIMQSHMTHIEETEK